MKSLGQPSDPKAVWLLSSLAGLLGGLCCFPPIVVVLFGLAGVSVANDWGNLLYGEYRWWFRAFGLLALAAGLVIYFRRRGICTFEQARRQRNRLINITLLSLLAATGVYVLWNYVVLHYWGIAAGLPWAQWDESWAIPLSAVLIGAAVLWSLLLRGRARAGRDRHAVSSRASE